MLILVPSPRLLLGAAGIPAEQVHVVVGDGGTAVVLGGLPGQGDGVLLHRLDLQPCWGVWRIWGQQEHFFSTSSSGKYC